MKDYIIFSTKSYQYLKQEVCEGGGFDIGDVQREHFPDGERYLRILSKPRNRDAVLIGGTISDSDTLELYDLASSLVRYGIKSLTLIIPYYGYSTMERAVLEGEVVTAKTRAQILSSIPMSAQSNRVVLMDVHSEGIPHYFEGSIRPFHLYTKDVIKDTIKSLGGQDYVLGSTDSGRAKWVESLANDLCVDASFILKRRVSGDKTEIVAMCAQVQNKDVIIYDDMVRSGSSLINASKAYLDAGAKSVKAIATHGVFPENALEKIKDSGFIDSLTTTNTHPHAIELSDDFLNVRSVSDLIVNFLNKI